MAVLVRRRRLQHGRRPRRFSREPANSQRLAVVVRSGTTSTLTFDEVSLSGWTGVTVRYRVSSTATNGGQGNTSDDRVAAYVATTAYSDQKAPVSAARPISRDGLGQRSNVGIQQRRASANRVSPDRASPCSQPTAGYRTIDGFTDIAIQVPDGNRSLALKIYATNDGHNKCWNLDDVVVEGTRTASNDR